MTYCHQHRSIHFKVIFYSLWFWDLSNFGIVLISISKTFCICHQDKHHVIVPWWHPGNLEFVSLLPFLSEFYHRQLDIVGEISANLYTFTGDDFYLILHANYGTNRCTLTCLNGVQFEPFLITNKFFSNVSLAGCKPTIPSRWIDIIVLEIFRVDKIGDPKFVRVPQPWLVPTFIFKTQTDSPHSFDFVGLLHIFLR